MSSVFLFLPARNFEHLHTCYTPSVDWSRGQRAVRIYFLYSLFSNRHPQTYS